MVEIIASNAIRNSNIISGQWLKNVVSVSCRSQITFDGLPGKWIRIIFSSVSMRTKLGEDTPYGVHKVISTCANYELWV